MLSKVMQYEVEVVKNVGEHQPKWVVRNTVTPGYEYHESVTTKRFLWWKWSTTYLLLENERKARIRARQKAFKIAKKLYPEYLVRVFVVFKFPEIDDPIRHCVWANGQYYSTH